MGFLGKPKNKTEPETGGSSGGGKSGSGWKSTAITAGAGLAGTLALVFLLPDAIGKVLDAVVGSFCDKEQEGMCKIASSVCCCCCCLMISALIAFGMYSKVSG